MITQCEVCGSPTDPSNQHFLPGFKVRRCTTCREFWIDGDTVRIAGGSDLMKNLRARADQLTARALPQIGPAELDRLRKDDPDNEIFWDIPS